MRLAWLSFGCAGAPSFARRQDSNSEQETPLFISQQLMINPAVLSSPRPPQRCIRHQDNYGHHGAKSAQRRVPLFFKASEMREVKNLSDAAELFLPFDLCYSLNECHLRVI